uniref:Uncharacterized protein n=1 Tax=Chromulina nebulosa TaxID=96789 RepID=A0A7S0SYY1_9STRA|mmetsp:Transcript_710/g.619  ORF Transcript_710/g.619 Transcript_710/m.619 type:complete len:174 (+) Transcript_710:29-550(+)
MFNRSKSLLIAKRLFSTSNENPRITIAKNILKLHAIRSASSESQLKAALSKSYDIDVNNLPDELKDLEEYLSVAPATQEGFIPDTNHWHNKPFGDFVLIEAKRQHTWPFLVGGLVSILLLGVLFPLSLPKDIKENNYFIPLQNGTYFDEEFGIKRDAHGKVIEESHDHHEKHH